MSRKLLIPAAGFGTRVGQPEAKEMLARPPGASFAGKPLIELALDCARSAHAEALVITRSEKSGLISYVKNWAGETDPQRCQLAFVNQTREWPDSVLHVADKWAEYNVVCLPDTEFTPHNNVEQMFKTLEAKSDIVFSTFGGVTDFSTWGVVRADSSGAFFHCEKPFKTSKGTRPWGLFGFRRAFGLSLLTQMLESTFDHHWRPLAGAVQTLPLEFFSDLSRP